MASVESAKRLSRAYKLNATPIRYVGGGVNGRAFETNKGTIIKILLGYKPKEYKILKNLEGHGVTPRLINKRVIRLNNQINKNLLNAIFRTRNSTYGYKNATIVHMNKVNGVTLKQYRKNNPNKKNMIRNKYRNLVERLHRAGVSHGNLHNDNIIVTKNGRFVAINTGRSHIIPVGMNEKMFYREGFGGPRNQTYLGQPVYRFGKGTNNLSIPNANKLRVKEKINVNTVNPAKRRTNTHRYAPKHNRPYFEKLASMNFYKKMLRKIKQR